MATSLAINALGGQAANAVGIGGDDEELSAEQIKLAEAAENEWYCLGCFVWCGKRADFWQKIQFSLWIVFGIMAAIFYIVYANMDGEGAQLNWGYFLCCALSIVMSAYSTFSFSEIFHLKKVIDDLVKSLGTLLKTRTRIQKEIGNLRDIRGTLAGIEKEQSMTNAELRVQEREFKRWMSGRQEMSTANIGKSDNIRQDLQQKIEKQKREIRQNERDTLFNAFDVFETIDGGKGSGMNKEEFDAFIIGLPLRYKQKFRESRKLFEDFAGADDVIDHLEFAGFLQNTILAAQVDEIATTHGITIPGMRQGLGFTAEFRK